MLSKILVYGDLGASSVSISHTIAALTSIIDPRYHCIQTIDAESLMHTIWQDQTVLFIMPGGADRYYHQKLHPHGNEVIRKFVHDGGNYLGICAGSYYAAKKIEFAKGTDMEISQNRVLCFFNGMVRGPVLASYSYHSYSGARAAHICLNYLKEKQYCYTFYNGGGYFVDANQEHQIHIIANYIIGNTLQPAIIETSIGKGKIILSGVHFEYNPYVLDKKDPYLAPILQKLQTYHPKNIQLTNHICQKLGVKSLLLAYLWSSFIQYWIDLHNFINC